MKKFSLIALLIVTIVCTCCLAACGVQMPESSESASVTTYKVTYASGEGEEAAPEEKSYEEGAVITLAENTFRYEGYKFAGWKEADTIYQVGDTYTITENVTFNAVWEAINYSIVFNPNGGNAVMSDLTAKYGEEVMLTANAFTHPQNVFMGWALSADGEVVYAEEDIVLNLASTDLATVNLYAIWKEPEAAEFSQASYVYDLSGANDLELPLNLKGNNLYYVTINDTILDTELYTYDTITKCLVINEDYCLSLEKAEYVVTAITDSGAEDVATCTVTVMNSIVTSFDSETNKAIVYGKNDKVTFDVNFGECSITKLLAGNVEVPTQYYSLKDNILEISGEWISKFVFSVDFKIYLSNNDNYSFTVSNNVLFYTDYDVTTIHNDSQSDTGLNPLYQYASNVSIVEAPQNSNMDGKVLKITPNTTEVQYDCNGYLTLKTDNSMHGTWVAPGFKVGKYYAVNFDYYTVNTSVGTFEYRGYLAKSYNKELLLGKENDNILHHFSDIISYDQIDGDGLYLYAKFIGGGGEVYVDNFQVIELDAPITVTCDEYDYSSGEDYTFTVSNDLIITGILVDGKEVEYVKEGINVTLAKDLMKTFEPGKHTITVKTLLYNQDATFTSRDNSKAEATIDKYSYVYNSDDLTVEGTFISVSVTEAFLSCDTVVFEEGDETGGSYDYDLIKDAPINIEYFTIVDGKLIINKELLNKCYGQSKLTIVFNNGDIVTLTINSNVAIFSDFDTTHFNMPLGSSINGYISQDSMSMSIVEDDKNNKMLRYYPYDCQQGHAHAGANWIYLFETSWGPFGYYLKGLNAEKDYILTFDYTTVATDSQSQKYYFGMSNNADAATKHYLTDKQGTFEFKIIGGNLNHSRFGIGCDLPFVENCYLLIDNYRIIEVEKPQTLSYVYNSGDITIQGNFANKTVSSVTRTNSGYFAGSHQFDSSPVNVDVKFFTVNEKSLVISKDFLNMLYATTNLVIKFTDGSSYELNVKSNTVYFTNFDETFLHMPFTTEGGINGYITQDSAQLSLFESNGDHMLRYCTAEAYHGHATSAPYNLVMLFNTVWSGKTDYCQIMEANKNYAISFDYVIVNAEGKIANYSFIKENSAGVYDKTSLDANAGSFSTTILGGSDVYRIGISTDEVGGVEGCYLLIDNYRIMEIA